MYLEAAHGAIRLAWTLTGCQPSIIMSFHSLWVKVCSLFWFSSWYWFEGPPWSRCWDMLMVRVGRDEGSSGKKGCSCEGKLLDKPHICVLLAQIGDYVFRSSMSEESRFDSSTRYFCLEWCRSHIFYAKNLLINTRHSGWWHHDFLGNMDRRMNYRGNFGDVYTVYDSIMYQLLSRPPISILGELSVHTMWVDTTM